MNLKTAELSTIRVLRQVSEGVRPAAADRAAVRVLERNGHIVKDMQKMKYVLTERGTRLVLSGKAHQLL